MGKEELSRKKKPVKMKVEILQPWSTFVMATKLPPLVLDKMIKITDEIVENRESAARTGHTLAGQIEDEFTIDLEILDREDLMGFFLDMSSNYVKHAYHQRFGGQSNAQEDMLIEDWLTQVISMWMVSQKDNEYNPMHFHDGHISSVMYLKIPEYLPCRKPQANNIQRMDDGSILFTNNASTNKLWAVPSLQIQPEVGDLFIFPASQQHLVYPFRTADGKGERRSVSFNASFTTKREQDYLKQREAQQKYQVGDTDGIYSVGSSE